MNTDSSKFVYDAVNELLILQACKADEETCRRLVLEISPDEFIKRENSLIWRVFKKATERNLQIADDTISRLIKSGGGNDAIVEYYREIPNTPIKNLDFHIDALKWDACRVRLINGPIQKLIEAINDTSSNKTDVIAAANSITRGLGENDSQYLHSPRELYLDYSAELAARRIEHEVYPLGCAPMDDNLTEGFKPGNTTVTAGLSGAGKSTVWIAFAVMLAKQGRKVLWCCWEMSAKSVLDVAISHMTGISLKAIVQGTFDDEEAKRIDYASKWLNTKIVFMGNPFQSGNHTKRPNNFKNLSLLEGYISRSGCDVVIYDLWERMLPFTDPSSVSQALTRMRWIHETYNVHGVIVHQINLKDVERRSDKRPTRDSIRGVGSFVEIADLIFGIHRDAQFKNVPDNTIEVINLKQRKGEAFWSVKFEWDGSVCKVANPIQVPYDPGLENSNEFGDVSLVKAKKQWKRK